MLPPSLITRSSSTTSNRNDDSDCSLQSLDDDIDAPAPHAPHALTASSLMNQVVSPSEPKLSFMRRYGGSRVVLPSIDALLSARGDEQFAEQQHLDQYNQIHSDSHQQMHPTFENYGRGHLSSGYAQQEQEQEQEQRLGPHRQPQHSNFHAHPQLDFAAPSLPSRQSLRVISSSHAEISHENPSLLRDASAAAARSTPLADSRIPRPSTSAAPAASAADDSHVPDGRFEFVGASIADGRRKQLARPSTAVTSVIFLI